MTAVQDPIRPTTPEAIRLATALMRTARFGALAVIDARTGRPLASRVAVATDIDGTPLILVSGLAAHTPGLIANPACSLLLGEPGKGDPLAHPRITLACDARRIARDEPDYPRIRRRYLNHNPKGSLYVDLGDFAFFRLDIAGASLNGGFGRAFHLTPGDLLCTAEQAAAIDAREQAILDRLNAGGEYDLAAFAVRAGGPAGGNWKAVGIDPEGFDLASGDNVVRLPLSSGLVSLQDLPAGEGR